MELAVNPVPLIANSPGASSVPDAAVLLWSPSSVPVGWHL